MILATSTHNPLGQRPLNYMGERYGMGGLGIMGGAGNPPVGSIDFIGNSADGSVNIPIGGTLTVSGWAMSGSRQPNSGVGPEFSSPPYGAAAITKVTVFLDGTPIGDAMLGIPRPDIAAGYPGWSDVNQTGYLFETAINGYPGDHVVTVFAYDVDGNAQSLVPNGFSNVIHLIAPPSAIAPVPSPAATAPAPALTQVVPPPPVILPAAGSVTLPTAPSVAVAAPSWFSGQTSIAGYEIPNLALVGVAALGLFVMMRSKGRK